MKHRIAYLGSALVLAGTLIVDVALASENVDVQNFDPAMKEMMKKAEAACTPGTAHQALEPLVGVERRGNSQCATHDLDGFCQIHLDAQRPLCKLEFSGEFMGQPFHGISFTGYDNVREKYRGVWIDDMSTTMVVSEGTAEDDGKVINVGGSYACATTGEKDKTTTQIYRILSRDKHVFEMHDPTRGENSKVMELTYVCQGSSRG